MNNLITFEFKRFLTKKKNKLAIILYIICVIIYIIYSLFSNNFTNSINSNFINEYNIEKYNGLKNDYKIINELSEKIKNENPNDYNNTQISKMDIELETISKMIDLQEKIIFSYENKNTKEYLKNTIEILKLQEQIELYDNNTLNINEITLVKFNKLLDLETMPIDVNFNPQGFNMLKGMLLMLTLPILIIVAILCGDTFSSDYNHKCYKILQMQPIKKWKICSSRIIATTVATFLIIFLPLILAFFLLGLIYGFGECQYPIEVIQSGKMILKSTLSVIKISSISLSISIVLMILLSSLLSLFLKSDSMSIVLSIAICIVSNILIFDKNIAIFSLNFNPFVLTSISSIIYDFDLKYQFININIVIFTTFIYILFIIFSTLIYYTKYKRYEG